MLAILNVVPKRSRIVQRNNVVVEGDGPRTLVFAHGFGCDQRIWHRLIPGFLPEYRVVLFDYVGAGGSDHAAYDSHRYRTLNGYALDVVEVAAALDLQQAIFIGHSAGAMNGVLASIAAPQHFERLVLLAPSPRYLNDPPAYYGGFERRDIDALLELMDHNFLGWAHSFANIATANGDFATELANGFRAADTRTLRQFAEAIFFSDHRADLPRVPVPSLVVQCSDDDIVPVAVGEYTRDHLPSAEYRLMTVAGHLPHVSNTEDVRAVLQEYLARPAA